MTIASCIEKFNSVIDIDLLRSMAKPYEDKGMSPDTAMVRVASEELTRLTKDRKDVIDMVTPKKEAAAKEEVKPDEHATALARDISSRNPEMMTTDAAGNTIPAQKLLDDADAKFKEDSGNASLIQLAIQCAIGKA